MSLILSTRQIGNVVIIDLQGQLTLGEGTGLIRDKFRWLLALGEKRLLTNLNEVDYIDAGGIGELIAGHTMASKYGAQLKLLNVGRRGGLLQMIKLYTIFVVYENEAAAVRSFQ